jgi:metal-dependent amidase/aminoacylase/carboxypeptidase family protein
MNSRNRALSALAVSGLVGLAAPAIGAGEPALLAPFTEALERGRAALVELRHDLHRHPETSGKEERTAGVVTERLRALGLEIETGVGGHGVVAILRGGLPGPVVAFRADMDAVPSEAPDPVEYRSVVPGVRHICGHDVHTAIGVALAEGLASIRDRLPGTVVFLFQPAEETATGAKAMLADGVLDDPKPQAIFAYHTAPFDVGRVATAPNVLMASRDRVRVVVERAPDAEAVAKAVHDRIQALSTVSDQQAVAPSATPDFLYVQLRTRPPGASGDTWSVEGSISTASREASARGRAGVEAAAAASRSDDVALQVEYDERWIAGVTNDPELVERASAVVESVLGEGSVTKLEAVVPAFSEDFGSFQERVPGLMFFLGVSNPQKGIVGMPHTPGYAADDDSIVVGARAMAAVLLDVLQSKPTG